MKLFGVFSLTVLVGFKSFFQTSNGAAVRNTVFGSSGSSSGGSSGSGASGGGEGAPFVPTPCLSNPDCLSPTVQLSQMGFSGIAPVTQNQFSGAGSGQTAFNPNAVLGGSSPSGLSIGGSSGPAGGSASFIDCTAMMQNQFHGAGCAVSGGSSGSGGSDSSSSGSGGSSGGSASYIDCNSKMQNQFLGVGSSQMSFNPCPVMGGSSGSGVSGGGEGAPFVPNPCLSNPDCLSPTVQLSQVGSSGSASVTQNQFSGAVSGQMVFNPNAVLGGSSPLGSSSGGSSGSAGGSASYTDCNTMAQNQLHGAGSMAFNPCTVSGGSSGSGASGSSSGGSSGPAGGSASYIDCNTKTQNQFLGFGSSQMAFNPCPVIGGSSGSGGSGTSSGGLLVSGPAGGSASNIDCNTMAQNQFHGAGSMTSNPCAVSGGSSGSGGSGSSSSGYGGSSGGSSSHVDCKFNPCAVLGGSSGSGVSGSSVGGFGGSSGGSASHIDCNTKTQNALSSQMGFDPCGNTGGSSVSGTHFETPCIFGKRSSAGCLTYTGLHNPQLDRCLAYSKRFACNPGPCYAAAKRYLCDPSPCMIKRYACNPNQYFHSGNLIATGANQPNAAFGSSMSGGS